MKKNWKKINKNDYKLNIKDIKNLNFSKCSCLHFIDKGICKHLTMVALSKNVSLPGLPAASENFLSEKHRHAKAFSCLEYD